MLQTEDKRISCYEDVRHSRYGRVYLLEPGMTETGCCPGTVRPTEKFANKGYADEGQADGEEPIVAEPGEFGRKILQIKVPLKMSEEKEGEDEPLDVDHVSAMSFQADCHVETGKAAYTHMTGGPNGVKLFGCGPTASLLSKAGIRLVCRERDKHISVNLQIMPQHGCNEWTRLLKLIVQDEETKAMIQSSWGGSIYNYIKDQIDNHFPDNLDPGLHEKIHNIFSEEHVLFQKWDRANQALGPPYLAIQLFISLPQKSGPYNLGSEESVDGQPSKAEKNYHEFGKFIKGVIDDFVDAEKGGNALLKTFQNGVENSGIEKFRWYEKDPKIKLRTEVKMPDAEDDPQELHQVWYWKVSEEDEICLYSHEMVRDESDGVSCVEASTPPTKCATMLFRRPDDEEGEVIWTDEKRRGDFCEFKGSPDPESMEVVTVSLSSDGQTPDPVLAVTSPGDTLELWLVGPCVPGFLCDLRVTKARITCEAGAKVDGALVKVKLDSHVFRGNKNLTVRRHFLMPPQMVCVSHCYRYWRLTCTKAYPEGAAPSKTRIGGVTLLFGDLEIPPAKKKIVGGKAFLEFAHTVQADKIRFEWKNDPLDQGHLDPAEFKLEGSLDHLRWTKIGQPEIPQRPTGEGAATFHDIGLGAADSEAAGTDDGGALAHILPGVSPDGYAYRLSPIFQKYPDAKLGSKMFRVAANTSGGPCFYNIVGEFHVDHVPTLHWYAPDYEMNVGVRQLQLSKRDMWAALYGRAKDGQRMNFLVSRLLQLISVTMVAYMGQKPSEGAAEAKGKAAEALKGGLDDASAEANKAAAEAEAKAKAAKEKAEKEAKAAAQAKLNELLSPECQQILALMVGQGMMMVIAMQTELGGAYAEKKLQRKKEGRAKEGFKWWMKPRNRWWWWTAILYGESFMYLMEVLLLIVCFQLIYYKGKLLNETVSAYSLIIITALTIFGMNLTFILDQIEVAVSEVKNVPDRVTTAGNQVLDAINSAWNKLLSAINAAIDAAVSKVNEITETLSQGQEFWEDKIDEYKTKITDAMELAHDTMINIQAALAQAKEDMVKKKSVYKEKAGTHASAIAGKDAQDSVVAYHDIVERAQYDNTMLHKLAVHLKKCRGASTKVKEGEGDVEYAGLKDEDIEGDDDGKNLHEIVHEARRQLAAPWARGKLDDDEDDLMDEAKKISVALSVLPEHKAKKEEEVSDKSFFHPREGTVWSIEVLIDDIGLRVHGSVKPHQHERKLRKRLLRQEQPIRTSRDIVSMLPVAMKYTKFMHGRPVPEEDVLVLSIQIVNFAGFRYADKPENDSVFSLWSAEKIDKKDQPGWLADAFSSIVTWMRRVGASQHNESQYHAFMEELFWGPDGLNQWRQRHKTFEHTAGSPTKSYGGLLAQYLFVESKRGFGTAHDFLMNGKYDGDADLAKIHVFEKPWPGFVSILDAVTKGELVRFIAAPSSAPSALHVVVEAETLRLPERNWNPPSTRGKPAEVFLTPTSAGQLCQLRLLGDRIEWVTPPASMVTDGMSAIDAAELAATKLSNGVKSIKLEQIKNLSVDIARQMLTVHKQGGAADTLFSMNLNDIREWDEIATKYAMKTQKMRILGHQGGLQEHPIVPERFLRDGDDAEQIWYWEREKIQPPPPRAKKGQAPQMPAIVMARTERTWYRGCFKQHRYHGDGQIRRVQYTADPDPIEAPWMDAMDEKLDHPKYQREVLVYDGGFQFGKRHGKGTLVFECPKDVWYRYTGLFLEDRVVFGELARIGCKKGDPFEYYCGQFAGATDLCSTKWPEAKITQLSAFEVFVALAAYVYMYDDQLDQELEKDAAEEAEDRFTRISQKMQNVKAMGSKTKVAVADATNPSPRKGREGAPPEGWVAPTPGQVYAALKRLEQAEIEKADKKKKRKPGEPTKDETKAGSLNATLKKNKCEEGLVGTDVFILRCLKQAMVKGACPSACLMMYNDPDKVVDTPDKKPDKNDEYTVTQRIPGEEQLPMADQCNWPLLSSGEKLSSREEWEKRRRFSEGAFLSWYRYDIPLDGKNDLRCRIHRTVGHSVIIPDQNPDEHHENPEHQHDHHHGPQETPMWNFDPMNPKLGEVNDFRQQQQEFVRLSRKYCDLAKSFGHGEGLGAAKEIHVPAPTDPKLVENARQSHRVVGKTMNRRRRIVDEGPILQDNEAEEEAWELYMWEEDRLLKATENGTPEIFNDCDFFGYCSLHLLDGMIYNGYTAGGSGVDGHADIEWTAGDGAGFQFSGPIFKGQLGDGGDKTCVLKAKGGEWSYEGGMLGTERHGKGTLKIEDDAIADSFGYRSYEGDWHQNRRHGQGANEHFVGQWQFDGPAVTNLEEMGTLSIPGEGGFSVGPQGITFNLKGNQLRYNGEYKLEDGHIRFDGVGEIRRILDQDGHLQRPLLFQGEFARHHFLQGTMYLTADSSGGQVGGTYVGEFGGGQRAGTGEYTFDEPNEKARYVGQWARDMPDGRGTLWTGGGTSCADQHAAEVEVRQGKVIQVVSGSCKSCFSGGRTGFDLLQFIPPTPPLSNSMGGGFVVRMPPAVHAWPGGHLGEDEFEGPWLRKRILSGLEKEAKEPAHAAGAIKLPVKKLKIWIHSVTNMKQIDVASPNDPYATCQIKDARGHLKQVCRTPTIEDGGKDCTWDFGPEEIDYDGEEELHFEVYDDNMMKDWKAGHCVISDFMFAKRGYEGDTTLYDPHGHAHGSLHVKVECVRQ
eukprot:gnl/MRDRNA2_/MRDRNA2_96722_c0_seq1.p1 gnl/MRDRNA2_/MRDRNA2_96722_c0~~gnl/MRDRNA2_/MRDRNA2_96722_c0_seq1.p1  ORF type:complete len:2714 (+),score=646.15 gnl/MRDRNA2_/MRDRNA2_96722_c0_seq1:62-8143(+)